MGTDLPYAAEAEMTLSPDELEVRRLSPLLRLSSCKLTTRS
jgi:hypothetical protein